MKRSSVSSSTMRSVGYDRIKNLLEIEFIDEEVYQYFNVPFKIYNGLMNADSLGKYFNEVIKPNCEFEKIT